MDIDRTKLNDYWCVGHFQWYQGYRQAAIDHANREAQRLCFERREFREAVTRMRDKFGVSFNNACDLVVQEAIRESGGRSMCCILGEPTMIAIFLEARERG